MKKIFYISLLFFIVIVIHGCIEPINEPVTYETSVTLQKPSANDTLEYGNYELSYEVVTHQGIILVELYVNDNIAQLFHSTGTKPKAVWNIDSSLVGQTVDINLVVYAEGGGYGISNKVNEITIKEKTYIPSAPFQLKLTKISDFTVNIAWKDTNKIKTLYEIWRKEGIEGEFLKLKEVSPLSFNTNDESLIPNRNYYYKIRTINQFGASEFSTVVSTTGSTGGTGNVPGPTNLSGESLGANRILLTWNINSSLVTYLAVERKISWNYQFQRIAALTGNTNQFIDTTSGLFANTEYTYRIKAYTENDSAWSNEINIKTHPYNISKPSNLSAGLLSQKKVQLNWKINSSNATYTQIERKTGADGTYQFVNSIPAAASTYIDSLVTPGSTYYYKVRSTDGFIYSDFSNETVITLPVINIAAPSNLDVTYYETGNIMRLTWSDNSNNETKFLIERSNLTTSVPFTEIGSVSSNVTSFNDITTLPGNVYIYRVRASDGFFYSNYSNEAAGVNTSTGP